MSSFSALIDKNNIALGFTGVERDPTTFMDVVESSFNMTQLNYNLDSAAFAEREARTAEMELVKRLGLQEQYDAYKKQFATPETRRRLARVSSEKKSLHDRIVMQGRKDDPDLWNNIGTSAEIAERARKNAQLSVQENEEVSRYASATAATLGGFAGGIGAALTDPVNVMTMFVGAAAGKPILQTTLIEMAAAMGTEAALQPSVMDWQKELGQEYGFSDAALSVITAGIVGGASVPIIRGIKNTPRMILNAMSKDKRLPAEARHAAAAMERHEHIREADPAGSVSQVDRETHFDNVKRTAEAMESGRPIRADELYVSAVEPKTKEAKEFFGINEEIARLKSKEIAAIKAELSALAGNKLSRGERKQLRNEIRELQFRLQSIDETIDESRLRGVRENLSPAKAAKEQRRAAIERKKAEDEARSLAEQERASIKERIDIAEAALERNKQFAEAEADLSRLEQGLVPEKYKDRVDQAASKVKIEPVVSRIPEPQKSAEQQELVNQGVLEPEYVERTVYDEMLEEAMSDKAAAAMEADFARMLTDRPDMTVTLEDGRVMKVSDLAEEFEVEDNIITQISSCAIGGPNVV